MTHQIDAKRGDALLPAHVVTGVNRRSVMSALSSVAALPFVATSAIAKDFSPEQDREILDLAARILDLLPAYNAASEATCAADDQYLERKPEVPDALLWGVSDPVRYSGEVQRRGRRYLTCDLEDIERRKERPRLTWTFVGPDAEWEGVQGDFDDDGYPLAKVAHLWEGKQSDQDARRMAALIAAADEHKAACESLRSNLRCDDLLEEFEKISEQMGDLVQRLVGLRASSLPALRAKAVVYARHLHVGYRHDTSAMDDQFELLASIVDDLRGAEKNSSASEDFFDLAIASRV